MHDKHPIETAPKDGTEVDLWIGPPLDRREPNCRWSERKGRWVRKGDEGVMVPACDDAEAITHWSVASGRSESAA